MRLAPTSSVAAASSLTAQRTPLTAQRSALSAALTIALSAGVLAGCGSAEKEPTPPASSAPASPVATSSASSSEASARTTVATAAASSTASATSTTRGAASDSGTDAARPAGSSKSTSSATSTSSVRVNTSKGPVELNESVQKAHETFGGLVPDELFARFSTCDSTGIKDSFNCSGPEVGQFQFFKSDAKAAQATQVLTELRSSRVVEDTGDRVVGWSTLGTTAVLTVVDNREGLVMQQMLSTDQEDPRDKIAELGLAATPSDS